MIRVYAPAIDPRDLGGWTRVGANLQVSDAEYLVSIDGRCGDAADRVAEQIKGVDKNKILILSHSHWDHRSGIAKSLDMDKIAVFICQDPASLNKKYSDEARVDIEALEKLIARAKAKKVPVIYAKDGQEFKYGAIKFTTYRDQPSSARNTETYINQGSICVWFPEIRLLYTGDTGAYCAKEHGLKPMVVTGLHHGNWLETDGWKYLKSVGCKYYWDDDYSTGMTDFLSTGRGNAKKAGMTIFNLHGDLNICCFSGKANIYKGGKIYRYKCSYSGKMAFKGTTLTSVADVLEGKYGGGDERVTGLLDRGYNPGSVQGWVNKMYKLVKG